MPAPKPRFFIIRPGAEQFTAMGELIVRPSTIVPLIPADLLPEWLKVVGVPRSLQPDETVDMINLGFYHAEDTYLVKFLRIDEDDVRSRVEPNDGTDISVIGSADSRPGSPIPPCQAESPASINSTPASSQDSTSVQLDVAASCRGVRHTDTASSTLSASVASRAPKRSSKADADGATTTKIDSACRYWCRTGNCKWGKICRFKHVMPTTAEGLASAGLHAYPRWWLATVGKLHIPSGGSRWPTKRLPKKYKYHRASNKPDNKPWRLVEEVSAEYYKTTPQSTDNNEDGPEIEHTAGPETQKASSDDEEEDLIEM